METTFRFTRKQIVAAIRQDTDGTFMANHFIVARAIARILEKRFGHKAGSLSIEVVDIAGHYFMVKKNGKEVCDAPAHQFDWLSRWLCPHGNGTPESVAAAIEAGMNGASKNYEAAIYRGLGPIEAANYPPVSY